MKNRRRNLVHRQTGQKFYVRIPYGPLYGIFDQKVPEHRFKIVPIVRIARARGAMEYWCLLDVRTMKKNKLQYKRIQIHKINITRQSTVKAVN